MKEAFLPLSTACQPNLPSQRGYQKRPQTHIVQGPENHLAPKAALGKLEGPLRSPTRLATLQTQMQHREVRLWHGRQ